MGMAGGVEAARSAADETSRVETIVSNYAYRQFKSLNDLTTPSEVPDSMRGAVFLILQEEINAGNQLLLQFDSSQSDFLELSVPLRLLLQYHNQDLVLYPKTKLHLETQLARLIQARAPVMLHPTANDELNENQELAELSTLYLWASYVEDASPGFTWPDKVPPTERKHQLALKARQWMERCIRYGFEERSSPYTRNKLAALLNLRDAEKDENLRRLIDSAIDVLLIDMVQESISGYWGGARCRSFEDIAPLPGDLINFVLFGLPAPKVSQDQFDPTTIHLGSTRYTPPPVLVRLATEMEHRGAYEIKNRFCLDYSSPEQSGDGRKYTYVTPSYILGSFQLRDDSVPWQSRPWDLLIIDKNQIGRRLFTFTGDQLFSGARPPLDQEYYHWNATCFQHRNVIYCRFHKSDRKRAQKVPTAPPRIDRRFVQWPTRLWIPNAINTVQSEQQWWFSQVETVYMAFRPIAGAGYWWKNVEIPQYDEGAATILSFQDLYTGFIIEVEDASNFNSFDQYQAQVLQTPLGTDENSVTFVSRRGDVYLFPMEGDRFMVNGRVIDPWNDDSYKLISSPFAKSEYGSGLIEVAWDEYRLTIDIRAPENPIRSVEPTG